MDYKKTCDGTLAIFLGTGTNMDGTNMDGTNMEGNYKIEIWNGRTMVSTRVVRAVDGRAVWNESLHLPVHIHAETAHPMNAVVFILFKDGKRAGYFVYHLFDIVPRDSYIADIVFLKDSPGNGGDDPPGVKAKVAFLYGTFGFGRSLMIASGFPDDIQKRAKSMFEYVHMPQRKLYDKLFRNDDDLKTVAGWLEDPNDEDLKNLKDPKNWSEVSQRIWKEILGEPSDSGVKTSSSTYWDEYSSPSSSS